MAALAAYARWLTRKGTLDPLDRLLLDAAPWYRRGLRSVLRALWHVLAVSALIWLITMPLVAYHFHILAPIGVLISPIVWPLFTVALVAGLGTLLLGWLPPVASMLGQSCAVCLWALQEMVQWAQGCGVRPPVCPRSAVVVAAVVLRRIGPVVPVGPLAARARAIPPGGNQGSCLVQVGPIGLVVCWLGCGAWLATTRTTSGDRLACTFLAMGHGTCVVLELPGGQTVLYDAGSIGSPEGASRCVAAYLWSRGITQIDAIVLSHADIDHFNAIPGLLERFTVGGIYASPHMFGQSAAMRTGPICVGQMPHGLPGSVPLPSICASIIQARGVPTPRNFSVRSTANWRSAHPPRSAPSRSPGRGWS